MSTPEDESLRARLVRHIEGKAQQLIQEAEALDVIVRIETKPLEPLAVGNYKMVADVQPKHPY